MTLQMIGVEADDETVQQYLDETCVIAGCDYCNGIKGVGIATAMELMQEHGTMDNVVEAICSDRDRLTKQPNPYPDPYPYPYRNP